MDAAWVTSSASTSIPATIKGIALFVPLRSAISAPVRDRFFSFRCRQRYLTWKWPLAHAADHQPEWRIWYCFSLCIHPQFRHEFVDSYRLDVVDSAEHENRSIAHAGDPQPRSLSSAAIRRAHRPLAHFSQRSVAQVLRPYRTERGRADGAPWLSSRPVSRRGACCVRPLPPRSLPRVSRARARIDATTRTAASTRTAVCRARPEACAAPSVRVCPSQVRRAAAGAGDTLCNQCTVLDRRFAQYLC